MSYKKGVWDVVCDVCGFKFKSDKLKERWDGLMVCKEDWETRHPQDFLRPVKESTIPWSRPEPADVYVEIDFKGSGYALDGYFAPNPDPIEGLYWI